MNSIRLRSPGDVVAVLPYQLGYHPHDSLVVVALRDRAVVLVERVDLPTAPEADEASRMLLPPLLREEPDAVLLVAYETRGGDGRPALDAVRSHLLQAGVAVLDRVVVRDGRWFAVDCVSGCCPAGGSPVPAPADTPAVAEFVGRGVSPLPGRGALADLVAADPDRVGPVAAALTERAALTDRAARTERVDGAARTARAEGARTRRGPARAARRFEALSIWAVAFGSGAVGDDEATVAALRPDQVAVLVDSLSDLELRDALVAWLCPGSLPADCLSPDVVDAVRTCLPRPQTGRGEAQALVARRQLVRLQHLVRAVPDAYAAAPLTVLANLAWWLGDGALARTCLERALRASPGYRLALLLERMLDLGVRPDTDLAPRDDARAG